MIDSKDCIITIDAMGCQKEIAKKIINEGGDYILAFKDNQEHLAERVGLFFEDAIRNKMPFATRSLIPVLGPMKPWRKTMAGSRGDGSNWWMNRALGKS